MTQITAALLKLLSWPVLMRVPCVLGGNAYAGIIGWNILEISVWISWLTIVQVFCILCAFIYSVMWIPSTERDLHIKSYKYVFNERGREVAHSLIQVFAILMLFPIALDSKFSTGVISLKFFVWVNFCGFLSFLCFKY